MAINKFHVKQAGGCYKNNQMVYFKIPVGNNAHEDIQHTITYKHGGRQCSLSRNMLIFHIKSVVERFINEYVVKPPDITA